MAQRFGTNHPIYDASRLMAFATGITPDNSPNAPIDASYVTIAAEAGLPNERVLTAGRRMLRTDGGAGSTVTLGVVDTRKLIVDEAGYGDYTTIQDALDYISTAGGGRFRIEIRNNDTGVYAERLTLQPTADNACTVEVVGDTNVSINAAVDTTDDDSLIVGPYANMTFRNLRFIPSGTPSNNSAMITGMNGNSSIAFYDCQIAPRPNQKLASGNGVLYFFHCTLGANATNYTYGVVGTPGVSTLLFYLWDCLVIGNAAANVGLVDCNNGNTIALYHCVIDNGGAGYDLDENNVAGSITVVRCAYDRTNTNGTITVLDGDIPALTVADIPAHNLLSATHGDTTAASPPTRGDLITAQGVSPLWSRLALTVPAAGTLNYLGINNGETEPAWKSASSNPGAAASIVATDAAGKTTLQVLNIPTTASLAVGTIQQNGVALIHTYGTCNLFMGNGVATVGNFTLTGTDNIIISTNATSSGLTTGNSNVVLGSALTNLTDTNNMVAIGYRAGGASNKSVSIGSAAGQSITGIDNVLIGYSSGAALTTGTSNVFIGSSSGQSASSGSSNTVAIGYSAGSNAVTHSYNIYIGYSAGASSAGIGSIALGYSATVTGAYQMVLASGASGGGGRIENLYGGQGVQSASVANKFFIINASGGSGTDISGFDLRLAAGKGTGTGAPGTLSLQLARPAAGSASTLNTLSDGLQIAYSTDAIGLTCQLKSSTTALQEASKIDTSWTTNTHATRTSKIVFYNVVAGVLTEVLALDSTGAVVNEGGLAGVDFRVESDTEANMLLVDASADKAYIGGTTNGIEISKGGDLVLLGTAKYERHIQIEATPSGTVASQMDQETYGTAVGLQASSALDQYAGCQWEVPDDWDGTDCYIEIDWLPNSGAMSGTDTVEWVIEYRAIAEGEVITNGTVATVTATVSDDLSQGQTKHSRMTLTYNNANQPLTVQDHVYFLVHRNTGVANDFAGTALITAYEIIYNSKGFPASN